MGGCVASLRQRCCLRPPAELRLHLLLCSGQRSGACWPITEACSLGITPASFLRLTSLPISAIPASQWDVLTDSEACAVVRRHLQQAGAPRQITPPQLLPGAAAFGGGSFASQLRRPPQLTPALAAAAAERLVQESLDRGTMDNVTAVVGLLQVGGASGVHIVPCRAGRRAGVVAGRACQCSNAQ